MAVPSLERYLASNTIRREPTIKPTEYWGSRTIAQRMGIAQSRTLYRWIRQLGFPCFLRCDPKRPIRRLLWTDENLILLWQLGMASMHRERLLVLRDERTPHRLLLPTPEEHKARKRRESTQAANQDTKTSSA